MAVTGFPQFGLCHAADRWFSHRAPACRPPPRRRLMPGAVLAGSAGWWRDAGRGGREMLLLHCTLAHSGAWKGVMAQLDARFRMRAMDLPGHGRSGPAEERRSWQRQSSAMAVALLERGGGAADLVGHSFGATVALRVAVERPDLTRSLTLIEPVFFSAALDAGRPEPAAHMALHAPFFAALERGELQEAARAFSALWDGPGAWEALSAEQRAYMAARIDMIRRGGESLLGEGEDYIPLARVGEIPAPVLLIDGAQSDPVIAAVQESLQSVLPAARRVVVPGAGHMVPITHPRPVAEAILDFLSPEGR